jgi:hypothetical protein
VGLNALAAYANTPAERRDGEKIAGYGVLALASYKLAKGKYAQMVGKFAAQMAGRFKDKLGRGINNAIDAIVEHTLAEKDWQSLLLDRAWCLKAGLLNGAKKLRT